MKKKNEFFICDKCNGEGIIHHENGAQISVSFCPKCKGNRVLDWVENIKGAKCRMMQPGIYIDGIKNENGDIEFW